MSGFRIHSLAHLAGTYERIEFFMKYRMKSARRIAFAVSLALSTVVASSNVASADVTIRKNGDAHTLLVDGQPFFIDGVGGGGPKDLLKQVGGNAFRTWGADELGKELDEAQTLGLKVACGIWLEHERHGFSYSDPAFIKKQFDRAKAVIEKYKDHPAVLCWSIGNEMEGYKEGDDPRIWNAVEAIARMAKEVDPKHPTMTVIAEIGGNKVKAVHQYCPSIDILGINSYAGASSIGTRYRAQKGTKPYVITEFGPVGTWEVGKTDWDAVPEPTSTQKGGMYKSSYEKGVLAEKDKLCLGSFAFTWGAKQEATSTWFGMLLPDNSRVAAVDVMQELWTGKPPTNRVPTIEPIKVETDRPTTGQTLHASINGVDPEGAPLTAEWMLREEVEKLGEGGDAEAVPAEVKGAIVSSDAKGAEVKMPDKPGRYRLSVVIRDDHKGAATANIPLFIAGEVASGPRFAPKAHLPLKLYSDEQDKPPFIPSGWMGKADAIVMDEKSTDKPKAGATCLKCEFKSPTNFGGVVWQSPANDWGDADGGLDLTGAKKLTWWARGAAGGEKVEFKFGILEKAKPFFDTANGATVITLTPEWKQYSIDLSGKDLRRIKTGFVWVVGDPGNPVTFYLDDVKYE
jgi:hypothetical protein